MAVTPSICPVSGPGNIHQLVDWSNESSMAIPMPKIATLNFKGIARMPTTKTDDLRGVLEFTDNNGNFFTKNVVMNAQGNSTLGWPKKNIAIDLCNDNWVGDDTFSIKFGNLIAQDSFHIKANYIDFFKVIPMVGYQLYNDMQSTLNAAKNRAWKVALNGTGGVHDCYAGTPSDLSLRLDTGALCYPMGFPCIVNLNGEFYGVFNFMLKKHRDNFMMNKKTKTHIHLDSDLADYLWRETAEGDAYWGETDIRNPKNLYTTEGKEFDGDNPVELATPTLVAAWRAAGKLPDGTVITSKIDGYLTLTLNVKAYIQSAKDIETAIENAATTAEKKAVFEEHFDVNNVIDYILLMDYIQDKDSLRKNIQWTTWDGSKWFCHPYDLDCSWGNDWMAYGLHQVLAGHIASYTSSSIGGPLYWCITLYETEIKARYATLRNSKVFDATRVANMVTDYTTLIGVDNFTKEYTKWSPSCNSKLTMGTGWKIAIDPNTNKPYEYTSGIQGWTAGTYSSGAVRVYRNPNDTEVWVVVEATSTTSSTPVTTWGFKDSMERLAVYIKTRQDNLDTLFDYTP